MSQIGDCVCRFHPTEPVLAYVRHTVILLSAENSSIPFSNWKEKEIQLLGNVGKFLTIEWNADGTQLAAIAPNGRRNVTVWSYPSGEIIFRKEVIKFPFKIDENKMNRIEWNPFKSNMFVTFWDGLNYSRKVFFFNSCPVNHFCTIESDVASVQWISENRVAFGLSEPGGEIEIWEIDVSKSKSTSAKIVKRLEHEGLKNGSIVDLAWDERTKCLAACSWDGWMMIWSMDSDQPIHTTKLHSLIRKRQIEIRERANNKLHGDIMSLAWRPNGKPTDDEGVETARKSVNNFILAAGLDDGRIVIWTPLAEEKTRILSRHSSPVNSLSFSPDGRFLASADMNGRSIIWSTGNWEPDYIIGKREKIKRDGRFSWLYSSTDVTDYKLTFDSSGDKVVVMERAVSQSEIQSKDEDHEKDMRNAK